MTTTPKKSLKDRWEKFRALKHWLDSLPNPTPPLLSSARQTGLSGVFFYQPAILDYTTLAEKWFLNRNTTYRRNFVSYVAEFFSLLIQHELVTDGSLKKEEGGVEVYSLDLKKLSRNYSEFNQRLVREGFLEVLALHDEKKGKSRAYAICREVLRKGIRRVFLTVAERQRLEDLCRSSSTPDKTATNPPPVVRYFVETLTRTTIGEVAYSNLEIEVGRFKKLAQSVHRYRMSKCDAKIGPKEGRFYSGYVHAPSEFRSLMRYDGTQELVEGDVAACHFHFLLDEVTDPDEKKQMKRDLVAADPYLAMCGHPAGVSREELKQSSHTFKFGSRADVRMFLPDYQACKVVPYREGLFFQHVSKRYPKFADKMAHKPITHKKHKSSYACEVMKQESKVMVHMVAEKCMTEGLVYLPVHDGFLTLPEHFDAVSAIVRDCFREAVGSTPKIRKK